MASLVGNIFQPAPAPCVANLANDRSRGYAAQVTGAQSARGYMTTNEIQRIEKVHCNRCLHDTDHSVIAERKISGSAKWDEDYDVTWQDTYTTLECCGCHDVVLRRR